MINNTLLSRFWATTAAAVVMLSSSAINTQAAMIAYICDDVLCVGGGDTIVVDNGAGDNFPGSAMIGQINAGALNVNGFTIITNVSQSKPLIGSAASPQLDLTFSAVTNDSALHTIYLYVSDTGFTTGGSYVMTLGGTQTPTGDSNVIVGRFYGGTSNNNLDLSNVLSTLGPSGATPFALSSNGVLVNSANPFALTLGIQITRGSAGTTTGDLNVIGTPEPAAMLLFSGGLIGIVCLRRRRVSQRSI